MKSARRLPRTALRIQLPLVVQETKHTCGAAAILAVSRYFGVGPRNEARVVRHMRFGRAGSDPAHLIGALRRYGLRHTERRGMSDAELRDTVDRGRPVVLMLQAWGERRSYRHEWREGHWVVAIGHDAQGIYVEDPMIGAYARGFVPWHALADRWHDVEGRTHRRVHRYGLIVWSVRLRTQPAIRCDTIINVA